MNHAWAFVAVIAIDVVVAWVWWCLGRGSGRRQAERKCALNQAQRDERWPSILSDLRYYRRAVQSILGGGYAAYMNDTEPTYGSVERFVRAEIGNLNILSIVAREVAAQRDRLAKEIAEKAMEPVPEPKRRRRR